MKVELPKDLECWCASAKQALELKRAKERRDEEAQAKIWSEIEKRWRDERPKRLDYALRIYDWLLGAEAAGLRHKLRQTGLQRLTIWGPMDSWGEDSKGYTGSHWVGISIHGELGFFVRKRAHACAGSDATMSSVEAFADTVPIGLCLLIAREISNGHIWGRLQAALARVGQDPL